MVNGTDAKRYLRWMAEELDRGRVPERSCLPGWVRRLALPAAMSLSLGLGACAADDPGQTGGAGGPDGKADTWGDEGAGACPGPAEVCDDHTDNDLDGFIDCRDLDCIYTDLCALSPLYAAPSEQECANGLDDDGDGEMDCDDSDCDRNCACPSTGEPASDECAANDECGSGEVCVAGLCIPAPAPDCAEATDCASCLELEACGWCAATESCMEGGYLGPDSGECGWTDWDYYDC